MEYTKRYSDGKRYFSFDLYMKENFGKKGVRVALDGGFGCPNRDGSGKGGCVYCSSRHYGVGGLTLPEQYELQRERLRKKWKKDVLWIPYLQSGSGTFADNGILDIHIRNITRCRYRDGIMEFSGIRVKLRGFFRIGLPLAVPIIAVITLYYAVARYNDFFNAMLYLGDTNLQPLQIFLRRVLLQASNEVLQSAGGQAAAAAAENTLKIRYVCIVLSAVPIFVITPFVQKYLVSGTMLGAVKG